PDDGTLELVPTLVSEELLTPDSEDTDMETEPSSGWVVRTVVGVGVELDPVGGVDVELEVDGADEPAESDDSTLELVPALASEELLTPDSEDTDMETEPSSG
ncbi:hypothetical protein H4S07_005420, partial [Coemansia furcata]